MPQESNAEETPEESLARLLAGSTTSRAGSAASTGPRYSPPLTTVRFREGYRIDQVDDFLDQVQNFTPQQIADVRFRTVKFTLGYQEEVVDSLLDAIGDWVASGVDVRESISNWSPL